MLNIAAVPILNITLRNNLLDAIPVKPYLRRKGKCLWLLEDHKKSVKGMWSIILTIPVLAIVCFYRNPQVMVTYTGGICGAFILLIIPATLVAYSRTHKAENIYGHNHNKSPFSHVGWIYLVYFWSFLTLTSVIVKIASGQGGE